MAGTRKASEAPLPGGNFRLFTTRLSFQAMISLGLLENPLTQTRRVDLASARKVYGFQGKVMGALDKPVAKRTAAKGARK